MPKFPLPSFPSYCHSPIPPSLPPQPLGNPGARSLGCLQLVSGQLLRVTQRAPKDPEAPGGEGRLEGEVALGRNLALAAHLPPAHLSSLTLGVGTAPRLPMSKQFFLFVCFIS